LIYWGDGLPYQILWHRVILDVHDDCIETISWWISYYCILVQMDEMLISSKWDCLLSSIQFYIVLIHVIESYWENIPDRNTCIVLLYTRWYCPYCYWYHHWHCYCHRIVPVIKITWILIILNNNIIDNLHWDWEN